MDNLLRYLLKHFGDRLAVSGEMGDLLIWGERTRDAVRLLGLSFNIPAASGEPRGHGALLLNCGRYIASRANLSMMHIVYPRDLVDNPHAVLLINGQQLRRDEAAAAIQELLGTEHTAIGTAKKVNKRTNDAFHDWARNNLPKDYVRNDIDALLLAQDSTPLRIIEVKRSTENPPQTWMPYTNDARNYYMGDLLARRAGLKFITLNHANKDISVEDRTVVGIHLIQSVSLNPERIRSQKKLVTARELVEMFQMEYVMPSRSNASIHTHSVRGLLES